MPGDLVLLDLRIIQESELAADESALTGESLPASKDEAPVPHETVVADRANILYSGTLLTSGSGTGVVIATGGGTELGAIHRLVSSAEVLATPLTRRLDEFSALTVVILGLAVVAFALSVAQDRPLSETFTAAVALAVGAIPEGLPAAVTITLAIGVTRMARRRAVVRRLPAVETLGRTTVICSDKPGTLTQNQMTVTQAWTPDGLFHVSGYASEGEVREAGGSPVPIAADAALRWSLTAGAGCNDAVVHDVDGQLQVLGDPTEAAMLVVAAEAGLQPSELAERDPRVATTPFSSERQFMATVHRDADDGRHVVLVRGPSNGCCSCAIKSAPPTARRGRWTDLLSSRQPKPWPVRGCACLPPPSRTSTQPPPWTRTTWRAFWSSQACRQCTQPHSSAISVVRKARGRSPSRCAAEQRHLHRRPGPRGSRPTGSSPCPRLTTTARLPSAAHETAAPKINGGSEVTDRP